MTQATLSDLVIGKEIIIWINKSDKKAQEKMVYRSKIDDALLKKRKYAWGKEESEQEYQEYKSVIKHYVKMGFAYLD